MNSNILLFTRSKLIFAVFFYFILSGVNAQCINQEQLKYATSCEINELRAFLSDNSWAKVSHNDSAQIDLGEVVFDITEFTWTKDGQKFKVMRPIEDPDIRIIAYHPSITCFSRLYRIALEENTTNANRGSSEFLTYERGAVEIVLESDYSKNKKSVICYNKEKVYNLIKDKKIALAERERQMELLKSEIDMYLTNAQLLIDRKQYYEALNYMSSRIDFLKIDSISSFYSRIIEDYKQHLTSEIDVLLRDKAFGEAQKALDKALNYLGRDDDFIKIKEKVASVEKVYKERRFKTYDYKNYELDYFHLENKLKLLVKKISSESYLNGHLELQYEIMFDTLKRNNSEIKRLESSEKEFSTQIEELLTNTTLRAPSIYGMPVIASSELNLTASWETSFYHCKRRGLNYNFPKNVSYNFDDLLKSEMRYNGDYIFSKKDLKLNGETTAQWALMDFDTRGRSAALYGFILPGLGSRYASYGEESMTRFWSILAGAGLAVASHVYGEKMYQGYKNAERQLEINNYYERANLAQKVFLGSVFITGSIYLYDIYKAFKIGRSNIKEAEYLISKLQRGPVFLN